MTLREMILDAIGLSDPLVSVVSALQVLRSIEQGETATAEGCCASLEEWLNLYQEATPENITRWLQDLGMLAELDIPEDVILNAISADE